MNRPALVVPAVQARHRCRASSGTSAGAKRRLSSESRNLIENQVRTAHRFARRALLLAGRLPWLAFLIFRVGLAMTAYLHTVVFRAWVSRIVNLPVATRPGKMDRPGAAGKIGPLFPGMNGAGPHFTPPRSAPPAARADLRQRRSRSPRPPGGRTPGANRCGQPSRSRRPRWRPRCRVVGRADR